MKNKLYKLISLLLSIFILATAVMIPAMAETQAKTEIAYYVKNGGTGDGKTMATPAATVKDVIETIKADGYDADDTVTVYILQRDDWNVYNGEKIGKINGTNTTQPHNMTAWSVDGSAPNTHDFTMIVKSPEGQKNYLTYSQNLGQNSRMAVGGNTVFDNVILVAMRNELDQPLGLKGYNVRFTENFAFGFVNNSETLSTLSVWDRTVKVTTPSFLTELAVSGSNLTDNDGMTLTLDTKYDSSTGTKATKRKLVIGTNESRARTVKFGGDVNVIINNKDSYVPIQWGSTSQNSTLTFENNLNINVKAAKQIVNAAGASPITIKGGLQIIADSKATITDLENTLNTKGISNYWYLVNGATEDDITFTATAGTFKAKDGITLVAVKEGTTTPIYSNAKGELVLEPGKYTVNTSAGTPPVEPKDKMLHITSQNAGPLGQLLSAKPNDVYVVEVTASNNLGFSVAAHDGSSRHKPLNAKVEFINGKDEGKYASWTYEVTMPDVLEDKGNNVFLGVAFNGTAPYDGYLMKVSVYKKDDANKTELFKNIDFAGGVLDNWRFKYTNFTGEKTGLSKHTFQEDNKDITLEIVDFDVTILPTATANFPLGDGRKMLHITSQNAGPLGQLLSAKPNDVYIVEVTASNNLGFSVAAHDGSSRHKPLNAKVEFINGKDEGKYASWTYEVTMPDVLEDKGNNVFLGVAFNGTAPYDGYLMKVSVYKKDDANKTELFNNIDFAGGVLDNWRFKYTNFTGEKTGLSKHTFQEDNKEITLEIVKFDETKLPTATAEFPLGAGKKMLQINSQNVGPLGQLLSAKPNEVYNVSVTISNNANFDIAVNDGSSRHKALDAKVKFVSGEDKGKYAIWNFEVTMPQVLEDKGNNVFLGIKFIGAEPYNAYMLNLSVSKKDDATQTELFKTPDFASAVLDNWRFKYTNFTGEKAGLSKHTFQEDNKEITLEVVKFDESVMETVSAVFPDLSSKMLHITTADTGPIGQQVKVKGNEKFVMSFDMSNNIMFDVVINDKERRHAAVSGVTVKYLDGVDHGRYTTYTYEITMPEKVLSVKTGEETDTVIFGIKFKAADNYDGYLANAELYKKGDTTNTNLYKNGDFFNGYIDGWVYKYHSFLSGDKLGLNKTTFQEDSKDVTLEVVKFDESVMENVAAKLPDFSRKMVYFKNGALSQPFSAWVDCVPGRKFIVTYSLFSTSDEIIPHFNRNGLRQNVNGKPELLSEVKHGNYTTYTYRMTIPQDYEVEEKLIFLGFKMPFYAEGYLFDVECYVEGDSEKKSAWKNPQFAYGFNEWVWGWSVTMFTRLGDQVKEWSDGVQEIKLVPFDLTLIDKLILEINRDDGEWWKPTDIIEKEDDERGVATINGTFKLQDGTAIANATMILKSLNKTYTAITNENGAFSFKNVVADYYDLYYVDDKGEEVLLDFACVLENGDTATVSIVNDLTELTKVKVSGLKGTVYTPQLKVVSNLKVYLRGFGETSTNKDGSFVFSEVPVGKYELYTVLDDGSEYVFREVEVKENVDLAVKLKYDLQVETQSDDEETTETFALIWIVIACGVVVILAAGIIIAIVLKKKKK